MSKRIIGLSELISLVGKILSCFPHYILFFDICIPIIIDQFICNVVSLNKITSQVVGRLSFAKFLAYGTQSCDILAQVDDISWDDTRNVIPLMLLISELVIN